MDDIDWQFHTSDDLENYFGVENLTTTLTQEECLTIGVFLIASGLFSGLWHLVALGGYATYHNAFFSPVLVSYFILFISDIASAGLQPFSGIAALHERWIWGSLGCQAYAFAGILFGTCQLLSVPFVAFARLRQLQGKESARTNVILAFFIVFVCLFWAILPMCGLVRYNITPTKLICTIDWVNTNDYLMGYVFGYLGCCVVIPFIVATVCYSWLIHIVRTERVSVDWAPAGYECIVILGCLFSIYICTACYGVVTIWSVFWDPADIPVRLAAAPPVVVKLAALFHVIFYICLNPKLMAGLRMMCGCCSSADDEAWLLPICESQMTDAVGVRTMPIPATRQIHGDELLKLKDHENPDDHNGRHIDA